MVMEFSDAVIEVAVHSVFVGVGIGVSVGDETGVGVGVSSGINRYGYFFLYICVFNRNNGISLRFRCYVSFRRHFCYT